MDRLRPLAAEAGVIGGVIYQNDNFDRVNLIREDFSHWPHQHIWDAITALRAANSAIDEITLEAELTKQGKLESVGGASYLAECGLRCPSSDSVAAYAALVREARALRECLALAGTVQERVALGVGSEDLRNLLRAAGDSGASIQETPTLADLTFSPVAGLPTSLGIERFVPGGIPRDKVTVVYGESSHGKTTVKNALSFELARRGLRVLDVSLEDPASLTVARWLAQRHGIPYGALATNAVPSPPLDDLDREVLGRIVDGSRCRPNMEHILNLARRESVSAVVVDYIQLLDGCSGDHVQIAESMRLAQLYAVETQTAVVVLSQVKQDVSFRANLRDKSGAQIGDPRPTIGDCFGSAAIRTHSKLGLGIFRPVLGCPAPVRNSGPYGNYCLRINNHPGGIEEAMQIYQNTLEILIGKNVLGASGGVILTLLNPETGLVSAEHPWSV